MKFNKKGFTLLELLVVIAIIGLLSTMAVVSLNSGREKARDAKRIAGVKAVQTAMEFIYDSQNDYQITAGTTGCTDDTAPIAIHTCTGDASQLATYIARVADLVDPSATTLTGCEASQSAACAMSFLTLPVDNSQDYSIKFFLEQANGALGTSAATTCTATKDGITCT